MKDRATEKLSWIIRWALNAITRVHVQERQRETRFTQKRKRSRDHRDRDWHYKGTNQAMPAATRSWKRQEQIVFQKLLREPDPADT